MLRIILGRAGAGKTHWCLREIAQELRRDPAGPPLLLVVPGESTFAMERALLTQAGLPGVFRAQVLSFRRLLWRILQSIGGISEAPLSRQGRKLLLAGLLRAVKGKLTVFRDSAEHWGFVEQLSRTLEEMEQAAYDRYISGSEPMTAEGLEAWAGENAAASGILKAKTRDLALIWAAYRERLAELGLTDGSDCWLRAIQGVGKARFLDGAKVWIDGIDSFSPHERQLMAGLLRKAEGVTVTLRLDPRALRQKDSEIFAYSLKTLDKLTELAQEVRIPLLVQTLGGNGEPASVELDSAAGQPFLPPRFVDSEELAHLERQLCCPKGSRLPFPHVARDVKIVSPSNRRAEVEQAARYLISQARERNIRWRDMAVAVSDLTLYEGLLTEVFSDCGIPYFLDGSRSIHWHPLMVFLSGVMELLARGWRRETVLQILKSDMVSSSRSIIDQLENYLLATGIDDRLWLSPAVQEQVQRALGDGEEVNRLLGPLLKFYESLKGQDEVVLSGTQLMTALWALIEDYGIPERINYWAGVESKPDNGGLYPQGTGYLHSAEHIDVWNAWVELVDDFIRTLGEQPMTAAEFAGLLQAGLDSLSLTSIPQGLDQVLVTSPSRVLNSEVRVLAILGADEQHLQLAGGEDVVLTDAERRSLKALGWGLDPQGRLQQLREPLSWYLLLTRAKDGLYISSPLADGDGKALEPAGIVKEIKVLFPNCDCQQSETHLPCTAADAARFVARALRARMDGIQPRGEQLQNDYFLALYHWLVQYEQGRSALRRCLAGLGYSNQAGPLSSHLVKQLYGSALRTNVYQLEAAAQCPYQYFAAAVLKLEERERLQWDARVEGQLWHDALALLTRHLIETGQDLAELDRTALQQLASGVWDEAVSRLAPSYSLAIESYRYKIERLGRGFQRIAEVLAEHSRRGHFRPAAAEITFGLSPEVPPLRLELESGGTVLVRGRIDRVETAKSGDALYVRIIDFKRSAKQLKLYEVYFGLSLQLLVYLAALLENAQWILSDKLGPNGLKLVPAGVLYFPLTEPMARVQGSVDEETLAKELLVKYRTSGLLLADISAIQLMEEGITGNSDLLPVGIRKDGGFYKGSSAYSLEDLNLLAAYAKDRVRRLAETIRTGHIDIAPYRKLNSGERACRYCRYDAVCRFELGVRGCRYRHIPEMPDDEVLRLMQQAAAGRMSGRDGVERGNLADG